MPTARMAPKGVKFGNEIYVMGGNNIGKVEIYNPRTDNWRTGKELNVGECSWAGIDSSDGKIYSLITLGKEGNVRCVLLAEYDPKNDDWKLLDSLNYNVTSPSFIINKSKCYIIGGFIGGSGTGPAGNIDSLFIYDIKEKKWVRGLNIPDKRHAASIFSVDSLIYVLNGVGDCFCTSDILKVNIYNIDNNKWTSASKSFYHIAYTTGSLFNNKINFFGNSKNSGLSFNMVNNKWEINDLPKLQSMIHYCEVVYNNKVYIFGGMRIGGTVNGQLSNSAFCYELSGLTGIRLNEIKKNPSNLDQNFPNPFNPSTTISYTLSEEAAVKLEIYNLLGQKIYTLLDKIEQAGNYKITWNASDYLKSSSFFFCKMSASGKSNFEKTLKLVLLK
jgi:N-acetylneuraminic acid mutarotase